MILHDLQFFTFPRSTHFYLKRPRKYYSCYVWHFSRPKQTKLPKCWGGRESRFAFFIRAPHAFIISWKTIKRRCAESQELRGVGAFMLCACWDEIAEHQMINCFRLITLITSQTLLLRLLISITLESSNHLSERGQRKVNKQPRRNVCLGGIDVFEIVNHYELYLSSLIGR